ncbi:MAG: flagellar export chaperone FliS [Oscillospiraceae bacterium]|jgi:flagellar protein FliS|nr:flagellar export chaperone FliS [Oscillospiraceae bacterium]
MTNGNSFTAYRKSSVLTMTSVELIVRLYDECIRCLNRGIHFIETKDYAQCNQNLMKSREIVESLQAALDMSVPISKNLDSLYSFFNREIIAANMHKDADKARALVPFITELRDAFKQISTMSREQMAAQARAGAVPSLPQAANA